MERGDDVWALAHDHAHAFLRRYSDAWTRSHRDDLVQETAIAAWQWAGGMRDPERFWAAVRTIAKRVRYRALRDANREQAVQHELARHRGGRRRLQSLGAHPAHPDCDDTHYVIAGRRLPARDVRPCMQRAIDRLEPVDRQLLLGFHEGFCCAELSVRSSRSEQCVKTRIHRARRRVQLEVEECVRAAGDLDES